MARLRILRASPLGSLVVLVLSLLLSAAAAAAAAACDPQVLSGCPLIRYELFSRAFPVIEYCMAPDRGFVPAEREACERFGLGQWRVRPGESVHTYRVLSIICLHTPRSTMLLCTSTPMDERTDWLID